MSCEIRTPGWLTKHVAWAVVLMALGVVVFGILSLQLLTNGIMVQWDMQLSNQFHAIALKTPSPINEVMTYGFFMGKENLQVLGAILVVYFLHKRYWEEIGMVLIGWAGGSVLWSWLIQYFNRPRPTEQMGIEVRSIPSYPSGHAMFAILALGLLAYLLVPAMPSLFWKWVIALAAILTILFVGFSRVFQGGHFLSDVLAGYAVGLAWGTLIYTLLEAIAMKRRV